MSADPFHLRADRLDGLIITIDETDSGLLTTVTNGMRTWSGTRGDVTAAVALSQHIVTSETFTVSPPPEPEGS